MPTRPVRARTVIAPNTALLGAFEVLMPNGASLTVEPSGGSVLASAVALDGGAVIPTPGDDARALETLLCEIHVRADYAGDDRFRLSMELTGAQVELLDRVTGGGRVLSVRES